MGFEPYTPKKVSVITGCNGQDGSYLAELLLKKGYIVVGVVRRSSKEENRFSNLENVINNPDLILENGDLTDSSSIWRIVQKWKPDEFYNLAAQSHVQSSFTSPESTLAINSNGVLNCLEAIRNISPKTKFYQASTSEMFGDTKVVPQDESTIFSPASPYACSKVSAHDLVLNYRKAYGLFACCGILFNHESERRGELFVTRKITKAAARIKLGLQKELRLGNLEAKRDWGYAKEYVEAMWKMLQLEHPEDFVIGTGKTYTIKEFIEFVSEAAGFDVLEYVVCNDTNYIRPSEVPLLLSNPSKAQEKLNWSPKVGLKELAAIMYNNDLIKETK